MPSKSIGRRGGKKKISVKLEKKDYCACASTGAALGISKILSFFPAIKTDAKAYRE